MSNNLSLIHEYSPLEWPLDDYLGNRFEREIFQFINKQLTNKFDKGVKVTQTSITSDGGKDIIIHSFIPLCILNQNFILGDYNEITIYIECKSSEKNRISLSKVAESLLRVKQSKPNYYMLVSNSTLTPQSLYLLKSEFEAARIGFKVVDQHVLVKAIESRSILKNTPKRLNPTLYYEYQIGTTRIDNKIAYEIFFSYRNLGNNEQLVTQKLLTDNNWSIDEAERKFIINSNEVYVNKNTIVRDFADGIDDLIFSIENHGINEKQIKIEGAGIKPIFEPPFFGADHKNCENFLTTRFQKYRNTPNFDLCCIWGEAGIGKTRVFNEVFKKLDGKGFDFFSVPVRFNKNFLKDIKMFLVNKNYLNKNHHCETLNEMLISSKNETMRAVILIDDCHNATNNMLNELKDLVGADIPITIVLCGRTDYSVGTIDYYSFVHYTDNEEKIGTWHLTSFSDDDTRNFIRLIVARIPDVALDKICRMSNNNPLYIIHFIEYLLELNIVEVVNRSSVGITDINTFHSRLYIPQKIEEIYKKRIDYLTKTEADAAKLLEYLYILSVLQDKQTKGMALTFLDEERLYFLIKRRFLSFSEYGDIIFSHESLALYIRHKLEGNTKSRKNIATQFFSNLHYLLEHIPASEKGVIALWAGRKEFAKECFSSIINRIEKTTNHSAFNVDYNINKYLDYILDLFSTEKSNKNLLVKVVKTKIYTAIHHFSPIIALNDCNNMLNFLSKNNMLKNDIRLINSVKQQKAHAMIIAGQLCDAELLMQTLLSDWLVDKSSLDDDTFFDLLDRFCGVYIDLNCKSLAINFNNMSESEKIAYDKRLLALVYLNKAKIYFLGDYEVASASLLKVQDLLRNGESTRILCSSKISHMMLDLLYNKRFDYDKMIEETHVIMEEAFKKNYAHAISRLYLILAVLHFIKEKPDGNLMETKSLIKIGINYCIKFGFQRVLWKFYNLLGVVQLRLGVDSEEIRQTFTTAFTIMQQHDYLNLGMRDLCTDNILVLSNIGFFYQAKNTERAFYEHMSKVNYFGNAYHQIKSGSSSPTKSLKKEYLKARKKQMLFTHTPNNHLLRDDATGYFIALS